MRLNAFTISAALAATAVLFSCKKESEQLTPDSPSAYVPTQAGKYIVYRTDSTVYTNFGSREEVRYFQEKNVVDAEFIDATGRPSYRVFRFMRDSGGINPWAPSGTFVITPTETGVEVTENNLRVVKLATPIRQDFSWLGNRYLPDDPYYSLWEFSNDNFMSGWNFTYTGVNESINIRGKRIDSVATVFQIADSLGIPINGSTSFAYKTFSEEKYAKGIGLVQQEYVMWEYQIVPRPNKRGFGIKRVMIDHN